MDKIQKTDEDWKKELDEEVYRITREKGTEMPGTGKYYHHKEDGSYICSNCEIELFSSNAKFDSGSGWPSFDDPVAKDNIKLITDSSHGINRTEVVCARCDAHLGHVFDDGPKKTTGKRYCINSCLLSFKENKK
jgi:methionine-R-sulfoxide reductase